MAVRSELTGQRFGKLVVKSPHHRHNYMWYWLCVCDCGEETVKSITGLRSGNSRDCGCDHKNFKNLTGMRFGNLLVLNRVGEKRRKNSVWSCVCECGKESEPIKLEVSTKQLTSGHTTGCILCRGDRWVASANSHGYCKQGKKEHRYRLWSSAKNRASKAGYPFSITPEDIIETDICPLLGVKLEKGVRKTLPNSPSIDKIIPALGYVPGNVWVVSRRANWIKSDASLDELKLVAANLEKKLNELRATA